nr:immunoglobulin heavy chain junction region [Macaca mulatta]MOX00263.1 immunoglobulin heavy chain junction region [Macaca mulatta]MOX01042.1 immunoglobulin heavy chain junction region [Macaca mulatta]MOX01288.1 immunoglobulin heavy chain junction region [Macaca mulatta]MOX01599.1 immunoglobulin heavy chain junction region [Macaca mulatta]
CATTRRRVGGLLESLTTYGLDSW